jgi:type IX secretion system PorP/SprF family membrane protein
MKKLITIFCAVVVAASANSQQERQLSYYMYDQISVNPGSAGSSDMISTHAFIRQQWVGIEGAPEDIVLNLNAPFKLFNKHHGVGISIYSEDIGFNSDIDLSVAYAYQFSVGDGRLGLGMCAGFLNRKLDPTWVVNNTEYSGEPGTGDQAIPVGKQNEFTVDFGAGLFYKTEELYVGISSTHILQDEFVYQSTTGSVAKEQFKRHYYFTAGYNLQLSNPAFEFIPSVFIQSDVSVTKIDLNTTFMYNKKLWAGVTYRVGSSVVGMIGLDILNGVKIGYAYEFDTSALSTFSKGSHEVMVGYSFKIGVEKAPQKYKSIRFL